MLREGRFNVYSPVLRRPKSHGGGRPPAASLFLTAFLTRFVHCSGPQSFPAASAHRPVVCAGGGAPRVRAGERPPQGHGLLLKQAAAADA